MSRYFLTEKESYGIHHYCPPNLFASSPRHLVGLPFSKSLKMHMAIGQRNVSTQILGNVGGNWLETRELSSRTNNKQGCLLGTYRKQKKKSSLFKQVKKSSRQLIFLCSSDHSPPAFILESKEDGEKLPANTEKHMLWARNNLCGFKPMRFWYMLDYHDYHNHNFIFSGKAFTQVEEAGHIWFLKRMPKDFLSHTK